MLVIVLSIVFPVFMVWAIIADFRAFEIPNRLPLILVMGYPLAAAAAEFTWQQTAWAFVLGALTLLVGFVMFLCKKMIGSGDAKFLAASAIWLGQEQIMELLFILTIAGGSIALVLLLYRRLPLEAVLSGFPTLQRLHAKGEMSLLPSPSVLAAWQ